MKKNKIKRSKSLDCSKEERSSQSLDKHCKNIISLIPDNYVEIKDKEKISKIFIKLNKDIKEISSNLQTTEDKMEQIMLFNPKNKLQKTKTKNTIFYDSNNKNKKESNRNKLFNSAIDQLVNKSNLKFKSYVTKNNLFRKKTNNKNTLIKKGLLNSELPSNRTVSNYKQKFLYGKNKLNDFCSEELDNIDFSHKINSVNESKNLDKIMIYQNRNTFEKKDSIKYYKNINKFINNLSNVIDDDEQKENQKEDGVNFNNNRKSPFNLINENKKLIDENKKMKSTIEKYKKNINDKEKLLIELLSQNKLLKNNLKEFTEELQKKINEQNNSCNNYKNQVINLQNKITELIKENENNINNLKNKYEIEKYKLIENIKSLNSKLQQYDSANKQDNIQNINEVNLNNKKKMNIQHNINNNCITYKELYNNYVSNQIIDSNVENISMGLNDSLQLLSGLSEDLEYFDNKHFFNNDNKYIKKLEEEKVYLTNENYKLINEINLLKGQMIELENKNKNYQFDISSLNITVNQLNLQIENFGLIEKNFERLKIENLNQVNIYKMEVEKNNNLISQLNQKDKYIEKLLSIINKMKEKNNQYSIINKQNLQSKSTQNNKLSKNYK